MPASGSIQTLPDSDLLVFMYVRKEAVLSSQIQGKQSSLQDLFASEAQLTANIPRNVDGVVNQVRAMSHGLAPLSSLPVSVRLIRQIHERLLKGAHDSLLTPGELRRTQNWIGPGRCTFTEATLAHENGFAVIVAAL